MFILYRVNKIKTGPYNNKGIHKCIPLNLHGLVNLTYFRSIISRVKICESRAYHRIAMKKTHNINSSILCWVGFPRVPKT